MTAFGSSPGFMPGDGDPAWQDLEGTIRVRAAAGVVQLQVSTPHDGVFDVATIVLTGSLRDVRKNSVTQWPSYSSNGLPSQFLSDAQLRQRLIDQANAEGKVTVSDDAPVARSGGSGR